jgi:alpha-tubulin suppressor-like RCC1 family protein
MGNNKYGQSGIGNNKKLDLIQKLDYFENKNLKIKKIACGYYFNVFLTGRIKNQFFKKLI